MDGYEWMKNGDEQLNRVRSEDTMTVRISMSRTEMAPPAASSLPLSCFFHSFYCRQSLFVFPLVPFVSHWPAGCR